MLRVREANIQSSCSVTYRNGNSTGEHNTLMALEIEYQSLREEALQLFSEQTGLTYVTTLGSAAILFGVFQGGLAVGLGVLIWELLLTGIGWKLIANYNRLYRITTYLKVVHEQGLDSGCLPGPKNKAWLVRSRAVGEYPNAIWKWGSGPRIDCKFLRLLGAAGVLLTALGTKWGSVDVFAGLLWFALATAGFSYLFYQTRHLNTLHTNLDWFETQLIERFGPEKKYE